MRQMPTRLHCTGTTTTLDAIGLQACRLPNGGADPDATAVAGPTAPGTAGGPPTLPAPGDMACWHGWTASMPQLTRGFICPTTELQHAAHRAS